MCYEMNDFKVCFVIDYFRNLASCDMAMSSCNWITADRVGFRA